MPRMPPFLATMYLLGSSSATLRSDSDVNPGTNTFASSDASPARGATEQYEWPCAPFLRKVEGLISIQPNETPKP